MMPPIWNPTKRFSSQYTQFQESQDLAWNRASKTSNPKPTATLDQTRTDSREDDSEEDAAKPLVDWVSAWNEALKKHGLFSSEPADSEDAGEVPREGTSSARSPEPSFKKSSLVFVDKASEDGDKDGKIGIAQASVSASDEQLMFSRCERTKVYATEEGLGGSWMVVREGDAGKEWVMLEGEGVSDNWDFVEEGERFRVKSDGVAKKGFNERVREFFEGERVKRERESVKGDGQGGVLD